jgi:hypothetical protein
LTPEKQITEHWPASIIDAGNLTIKNCTLNLKMFGNPCGEISKAVECISVPADEFSVSDLVDLIESVKGLVPEWLIAKSRNTGLLSPRVLWSVREICINKTQQLRYRRL